MGMSYLSNVNFYYWLITFKNLFIFHIFICLYLKLLAANFCQANKIQDMKNPKYKITEY